MQNFVMLAAGICNLTEKIKHKDGVELIYIDPYSNKQQNVISELRKFSSELQTLPNTTVKIATIPPACIKKYNEFQKSKSHLFQSLFTDEALEQQQYNLEKDIAIINNEISEINKANQIRTVYWDRDITKISIKKRGSRNQFQKRITKFVYNDFYDGVHPVENLGLKWCEIMCSSIKSDIKDRQINCNSEEEEEEFEKATESWDFKRPRLVTLS